MKIVCFHLNQVGDLAFSLPALKSIRDSAPGSWVTSVVRPSAKEVLESTGLVDEVVCRTGGAIDKYALSRKLAASGFDLAVVFSQSAECAVLAYLSGVKRRIGFINTSLGFLLTERVEFHHPPSTKNNLRLIEAAGFRVAADNYSGLLKPSPAQVKDAHRLLGSFGIAPGEPMAAISPGTSGRRSVKEWTDEGFATIARHLSSRGFRVVILGTEPASMIVEGCSEAIDLSGKTSLADAVAVLHRCAVLVAVDSGILHLAAAAGTRVVGLYGPSNPEITGPQGEGHVVVSSGASCSPCVKTECSLNRKCMLDLTTEQVIDAVERVLSG